VHWRSDSRNRALAGRPGKKDRTPARARGTGSKIKKKKMTKLIKYLAVFIPLAGAIYCVAAALGAVDALCFTQGCAAFQNVQILGFSLYMYGAGAFLLLAALSLFQQRHLGYKISFAFLMADSALLIWMGFGPACSSCLIAGLFFALSFGAIAWARKKENPWTSFVSPILCVTLWFFAFSPNVFSVVKESMKPWAIYGNGSAQVYFSPTCRACIDLVFEIIDTDPESAAFYPIAKNAPDKKIIARMFDFIEKNDTMRAAFSKSIMRGTPDPDFGVIDSLKLKWRLFSNKTRLLQIGSQRVPLIISNRAISKGAISKRAIPNRPISNRLFSDRMTAEQMAAKQKAADQGNKIKDLRNLLKNQTDQAGECSIFSSEPCEKKK